MNLTIKILDNFKKEVKKLAKKYKQISTDLQKLQEELLLNHKAGVDLGNNCFKIRLQNSSIPTGKSGGFRVVYYYVDKKGMIYLMSIYSKSDLENLEDEKIVKLLNDNDL